MLSVPAILSGAAFLLWHKRKIRWIPVVLLILLYLPFIMPGREIDRESLSKYYIGSARQYEGVRFLWGGENYFGIDCSGLVRKGLIDANLREGVLSANPACLRRAFELWWYDCSARALKNSYRNWTEPLFQASSINQLDCKLLQPGDFAVTMDGIHTLLYLGDNEWIEADPGVGKVISATVPVEDNVWFNMPVQILRWKQLEDKK